MKRTVTVCDVCEQVGRQTKVYNLSEGGRRVRRDLCEADAGPVEKLMDLGSTPKPAKRAAAKRAPGRRSSRVTTMEEIEKQKKAAKKA